MYTSNRDANIPPACACTTVKKLSRVLGRVYDSALAAASINVTQFAVMRAIARHPGEALSHVAAGLEMERTSLYRAIAPLEREGWIRLLEGADRRSRSAEITREGAKVLEKASKHWQQLQQQLIGSFGASEWKKLAAEIERLGRCAAEIE